jgi:uncharacterized protein (DUF2141 family)
MKLLHIIPIFLSFFIVSCKKDIPVLPNTNIPLGDSLTVVDTLGKLKIDLSGMQNLNGTINFALYNNSSSFNDPNQVYKSLSITPTGANMTFTIDSLPEGSYAFGVFHDENNNQAIDQNWLGIPTEGFAFSNNAMGTFGPPSYAQATFVVQKNQTHVQTIALNFY